MSHATAAAATALSVVNSSIMASTGTTPLYHVTNRYCAEIILRSQQLKSLGDGLLGVGVYFFEKLEDAQSYSKDVSGGAILVAQVSIPHCHRVTGEFAEAQLVEELRRCDRAVCGQDGSGLHGVGSLHPVPFHDGAWEAMSVAQQRFAIGAHGGSGTVFGTAEFLDWQSKGFTAARYTHKTGIGDVYDMFWCVACKEWPCEDECGARNYADEAGARTEICILDVSCIGKITMLESDASGASANSMAWWDMPVPAREAAVAVFRKSEFDLMDAGDEALRQGNVKELRAITEQLDALEANLSQWNSRAAQLFGAVHSFDLLDQVGKALEQQNLHLARARLCQLKVNYEHGRSQPHPVVADQTALITKAVDELERAQEMKLEEALAPLSAAVATHRSDRVAAAQQCLAAASEAKDAAASAGGGGGSDQKAANKAFGVAKAAVLKLERELEKAEGALKRKDLKATRDALRRLEEDI